MKTKLWRHVIIILSIIATVGIPSNAHARTGAEYRVTQSRAIGHYIRLDLKQEGSGLRAYLSKSTRSGTSSFSNRGHWWIIGKNSDNGRTSRWGPYSYDSRYNNREYHSIFWPARSLQHGRTTYEIHLCSKNDPPCSQTYNPSARNYKKTGIAVAQITCPYDFWTGLHWCD